jgi:hypothetical protein
VLFIIKEGFQTLEGVFIVDPTCLDMVQCASSTTMHVATIVVHEKTCSYIECTLGDNFTPLAIKTYGCFIVLDIF